MRRRTCCFLHGFFPEAPDDADAAELFPPNFSFLLMEQKDWR
jgi:hypothetical protein